MTYFAGVHVYMAAPFFNDVQRDLCDFIEGHSNQDLVIYSPRKDGGVLTPDASDVQRAEVFSSNCIAMEQASWMLAIVDDFDAGVIWEMGYAYAEDIPILGYSDVEGRGLNVMLAGACNLGFVNGRQELAKVLSAGSDLWEIFPRNTWRGQIQ